MDLELDIIRYGHNGEGIATNDGKVIFVPYALSGEKCLCEIVEESKSYSKAKLNQVIKSSPLRTIPQCPYYKTCGGCNLQHILYDETLNIKKQIVENNLKKIAEIDYEIDECISSDKIYNYRNKIVFAISKNAKLGLFKTNSHDIIEVQHCCITDNNINKLIDPINEVLSNFNNQIYDWKNHKGILKNISIRFVGGEYLFIITQTSTYKDFATELAKKLDLLNICYCLYICINNKNNSVVYGKLNYISGKKDIDLIENNIKTKLKPLSFIQVNNFIKEKIYNDISNFVDGKNIIDAYAGRGVLSAILSKKAKNIVSIEIEKQSCQDAEQLKNINKITNLSIKNGDCGVFLPQLLKENNIDAVILDPPRSGCTNGVVDALIKCLPQEIIYQSCNSATLARDIKSIIKTNIYKIECIRIYDMFPQTSEIETLCVFRRNDGK